MAYHLKSSRSAAKNTDITVPLDGTDGTGPPDSNGIPIGVGNKGQGAQCKNHSIAIEKTDSTVGTIAVTALAVGKTTVEPVYENGVPLVIDLAKANEPLTRGIKNKALEEVYFAMNGVDGTGNMTITISSGD